MHPVVRLALPCALIVGISCSSSTPAPQTAPAPGSGPTAVAARGEGAGSEGRGGPPPGARPRRVPLTPEQRAARRDSLTADRQRITDSLLTTLAGRENEPAGRVFKNVQILKDMPVHEFLEAMNDDYGKAVGRSCNFCHVVGNFASDDRKEKHSARVMIAMEDSINNAVEYMPQMKTPRGDWPKIECVTCHRGMNEPNHALLPP